MDFLDLINATLLLSQLALHLFLLWNLWGWLVASLDIFFVDIPRETERNICVLLTINKATMTPQELVLYHRWWSLHIHVPQSALYLLSRTWQTKKGSSGKIYNFQQSYPLVQVKRIWNFNSDFLSGFAGRWSNFPFFKKKLTKMLCGAINNQTNMRWMSSE